MFINDAARVECLMSFITILNNFELLMMTGKFCKNPGKLSGWTVKYQRNVVQINSDASGGRGNLNEREMGRP